MGQIPNLTREQLSAQNQAIWDNIYRNRTPGGGPYAVLMHSPPMAQQFSNVEDYFRNAGKLDPVDKELIILTIARAMNVRYPLSRHEIRARPPGLVPPRRAEHRQRGRHRGGHQSGLDLPVRQRLDRALSPGQRGSQSSGQR